MLYLTLWIFFVYAFLGWCTEVGYAALRTGRFVNRGFLNGPVCPHLRLRGDQLCSGCWSLWRKISCCCFWVPWFSPPRWSGSPAWCWRSCSTSGWWDYSDEPLNIGGYICLRFSLMWGGRPACLW